MTLRLPSLFKSFLAIIVFMGVFVSSTNSVSADGTCTISFPNGRRVDPGGSLVIRVSGLTEGSGANAQLVNIPNADRYYFNGNVLHKNYTPSGPVTNGTFEVSIPYFDAYTSLTNTLIGSYTLQTFNLKLLNHGENHLYCTSTERVALHPPSCSIAYKITQNDDGSVNLGLNVNTTNLRQGASYSLDFYEGLVPSGIAFNRNFVPNGTQYRGSYNNLSSDYLDDTNLTVYVKENTGGSRPVICEKEIVWSNVSTGDPVPEAPELVPIGRFTLCGQIPQGTPQRTACEDCGSYDDEGRPTHIYSAIGCIPIDEKGFTRQLIQILLSVSGLIALLSILAGAFLLSTSQGDSNQVKKAKELITAAVSGLFFIIFSTIILDFFGVQILRIPGLS